VKGQEEQNITDCHDWSLQIGCRLLAFSSNWSTAFLFFRVLLLNGDYAFKITDIATLDTLLVPTILVSVNPNIALTSRAVLEF